MTPDWMGYAAAALTTVSFVPQATRALRTRETQGISLWMYVLFTVGVGCWLGYGLLLGSWPIILSNLVTLALALAILLLKLRYG